MHTQIYTRHSDMKVAQYSANPSNLGSESRKVAGKKQLQQEKECY